MKGKLALSNDLFPDVYRMKEQRLVVYKEGKCLTRFGKTRKIT